MGETATKTKAADLRWFGKRLADMTMQELRQALAVMLWASDNDRPPAYRAPLHL